MQYLQKNFYLLVIFAIFIAKFQLQWILELKSYIKIILSLIIFLMGLNLEIQELKLIIKQPKYPILGISLQYLLMPVLAYLIANIFALPKDIAVGLVLVGSAPGGTVSNVFSFLARANLSLSIVMTFLSTLIAPVMLPLNMWLYAKQWIKIDVWSLFKSSLEIILIPLTLGLIFQYLFKKLDINNRKYENIFSCLAILMVSLIIMIITTVNFSSIQMNNISISIVIRSLLGTFLIHSSGMYLSYIICKQNSDTIAKTVAIEVGMQNSGFASVLAQTYFAPLSIVPTVAPGAIQCIAGSLLINYWNKK